MTRWLFDILGAGGEQTARPRQPTRPRWSSAHRHSTPRRPVPAWTPPPSAAGRFTIMGCLALEREMDTPWFGSPGGLAGVRKLTRDQVGQCLIVQVSVDSGGSRCAIAPAPQRRSHGGQLLRRRAPFQDDVAIHGHGEFPWSSSRGAFRPGVFAFTMTPRSRTVSISWIRNW